MGLNTLGLGIILSLRDGASIPANRAATSLGQLDTAASKFSKSFNSSMATAFEGMNMLAAGVMLAAAPVAFVKSTLETQKALAYVASSGVENLGLMKDAAEDFTNYWAGTTQESFLSTVYEIKSGLYELSDAMVAKMTTTTGILSKATKSTVDDMQSLIPIMWGILRPSRGSITDEEFMNELAGALAYSVKIYRATGKYMGDAFSQATAIATQEGVAMEEQFAILGRLQQTMTGSEAGTKLRALAVNTPRAVKLAEKKGVDIQLTDTKGMILPLVDIIDNVRKKYGEKLTAAAMEELRSVFGSREATSAVINLLPYVDQLRQDTKEIKAAMNEGMPVAMEMAEDAANNMGDAWEIFGQRVLNTKQAIGDAIIPIFRPVLDIIGKIFIGIQAFAKAHPGVIRLISSLVMLVATLLVVTGSLYIVTAGIKIVSASIALMKTRVSLLRAEFQKFMITMWPFLLLAGLMYLAFKTNFMGINDSVLGVINKLKELWENVKLVWSGLMELIKTFQGDKGMISEDLKKQLEDAGLWELTKKLFMIYTRLTYLWAGIKEGFNDFWVSLVKIMTPVGAFLKKWVITPLVNLLAKFGIVIPVLDKLIAPTQENANTWKDLGYWVGVAAASLAAFGLAAKIIKPIISLFKILWTAVKFVGGILKFIAPIGKFLLGIGKILGPIGKGILWLGKIIWGALVAIVTAVAAFFSIPVWAAALIVGAVVAIIALLIIFRKQVWAALQTIFYTIAGVLASIGIIIFAAAASVVLIIAGVIAAIIGIIWGILNVIISIGAGIYGVAMTIFAIWKGIWDAIYAVISGIVLSIIAFVKAIFTGDFTTLGEDLKGIWGGVWENIKGIVDSVVEEIKGIWDGIGDYLGEIWGSLKTKAGEFFDWIGGKFEKVGEFVNSIKDVWNWVGDKVGDAWDKVNVKKGDGYNTEQFRGGVEGDKTHSSGVKGFAKGGLFNGPSIIQIAEQSGVNEAAIPLSGRYMIPFANAIASAMPQPVLDSPKTQSKATTVNTIINNNYNTTNVNRDSSNNQSNNSETRIIRIEVPIKMNNREIAKGVAEYVDQERGR
jgi:TP901 family phage tail tape measure protein